MTPRVATLAMSAAALCGCLVGPASFTEVKRGVESATGLVLAPTTSMSLGAAAMGLARIFGGDADDVLRHLDRVEVAVFSVSGKSPERAVDAYPAAEGWTCIVRARHKGGAARILLDETSTGVARLLVVASDGDELVLIRLEGALDALLEQAMSGKARAWGHQAAESPGHGPSSEHDED